MNSHPKRVAPHATIAYLDKRLCELARVHEPIWIYDFDNACIPWANTGSLQIWQAASLEELRARDFSVDMSQTVTRRLNQYQADFSRNENIQFKEIWTIYPNGEPQTVEVIYSGYPLDDGRMGMMCEALTKDQYDNEALRSAEALLHTSVMITLYNYAGEPLYRNPAARSAALSVGESLESHFVDKSTMRLLQASDEEVNTVACVHTTDGQRWHDITARRCQDAVTGGSAWLISEVDVTRLKATEERAQYLAEHDTLTGLPNRNYVSIDFKQRIEQVQARGARGALIYIDLDHFKDVNDSLGHEAGDKLLIEVALRLRQIAGMDDNIARIGGDEFLLLLCPAEKPIVESVCQQVRLKLSEPITLQNRQVKVTPSVGISMFPDDASNLNDLMRHADLAMYHAKDLGRNESAFFSQDMSDAVQKRINLESELMVAVQEGQFVTYFQPRVDVQSNMITGAEALVRWIHPERGMVSPGEFIPACEASGLIGTLGKFVLKQSVLAQRNWAALGYDVKISVNLSPLQFGEETLVEELVQIVEANNGKPENIELEITESVLLGNDQVTVDKLHALVNFGFRVAIDDFGTGYSNLAYLHRYPLSCLKIDRSFVSQIETAQPIIELIISMARLFELDVVAEGVETESQLSMLREHDCQEYQGFLFGPPIDFQAFTDLLSQNEDTLAA